MKFITDKELKQFQGNFKIKIIYISVIILLLFMCSSCQKKTPELSRTEMQKQQGIPVEVISVKKADIVISVDVTGQLDADEKVMLNTSNTGIVTKLMINEGDYVRANQVVAIIEPYDLMDQLEQAKSALNTAKLKMVQAQSQAGLTISQVNGAIRQAEETLNSANSQYEQAKAGLIAAKEAESLVDEGSRRQEIQMAEDDVAQTEATFKQAQVDLGRMERLYNNDAIPKQKLDMARVEYDVAQARYNSALHKLDMTKEGSRGQEKVSAKQQTKIAEEKVEIAQSALNQAMVALKIAEDNKLQIDVARENVAVAESGVEEAKANLAIINRKLQKAYVVSPISGYVTKRYVDMGQYAGGQGPTKIADIFNPRTLYFSAVVSDTDIENIRIGMDVDIKIDSIPDKPFKGYIRNIIPSGDQASKQFTAKIAIKDITPELKIGMFTRGKVILTIHKNVLVVPKDTVRKKEGKDSYVYIEDNKHALERDVITGPSMGGVIEITKGLKFGDKVIHTGAVKNGDLLKILKEK